MSGALAFYQRNSFLYFVAIAISLLLSAWISYNQVIINPDAICYLSSAEIFGQSGLSGTMHLCGQAKWPFYSVLIYSVVQLTHVSYAVAAYLLDAIFSLISVTTFILIAKALGGSRRVLWLAAIVILFSHQFNSVREYIVRDHGFWAFYLLSLLFLVRFFHSPKFMTAFWWSASIIVAALFRIEGVIFLFALPCFSWFLTRYSLCERMKYFFMLNFIPLLSALAIGIWLLSHPQETLDKLGRLADVADQIKHGFALMSDRYVLTKSQLASHVLNQYSVRDAGLILVVMMLSWYAISVMSNVSWIYGLLMMYAWLRKSASFTASASLAIFAYLGINILITLTFLFENMFLSKRYLVALSLVLMLWVPFALEDLLKRWASLRYRFALLTIGFLIFISSLGGIFEFGYSKAYISQAGKWIERNVPANANLYANDIQLMYYSKHFGYHLFENKSETINLNAITNGKWKKFDYIALRLNKKDKHEAEILAREIRMLPIQVFSNKRGDQIVIYNIPHREKHS